MGSAQKQIVGVGMLWLVAVFSAFATPPQKSQLTLTAPAREIPANYFGMHFHHAGTTTPWPDLPIGAWRLWDAYVAWADLEPQKGEWQFDTLDRYVALAEQHHVELLLVLGQSPAWASARPRERSPYHPGNAAEPKNLEDWRAYVRAIATRYKGKIRAYEIWNEPNLKQFWTGSVEQMVALTRDTSQIIHGIDPDAIVVSPSAVGTAGTRWLGAFLARGGGRYVDVIGFHFYVDPRAPEAMLPLIQRVKRLMAQNGAGAKPLWNTESGWSRPKPFPSDELAAAYLARAFVLNWAAGVERFYWYAWDNHDWVSLQTTERDNKTLKPAAKAYETVANWLVGARLDNCREDAKSTWMCELRRSSTQGDTQQWIVWNARGNIQLHIPQSWHAKTITPLLGAPAEIHGSSIAMDRTPVLVSAEAR
jgi:Glycosyl hydrolases family 39